MRTMIFVLLIFSASAFAKTHVVIDPGHGGEDHGAVKWNIKESEVTLQIAKRLYDILDKDPLFNPTLTRWNNSSISLFDRAKFARSKKADLFISIHVNSSPDKHARGAEFYFQNQMDPDQESLFLASRENQKEGEYYRQRNWRLNEISNFDSYSDDLKNILQDLLRTSRIRKSALLAQSLSASWKGQRKKKRNSIKQAPFYVVSNTNSPSALVEVGFVSNRNEAKKLISKNYQNKVAKSIHDGLLEYVNRMEKLNNSHLY